MAVTEHRESTEMHKGKRWWQPRGDVALTALFLGCAVLVLGMAWGMTARIPEIPEDDPRWNCHPVGNRICGHETLTPVHPGPVKL
jgi:hypothetical protein